MPRHQLLQQRLEQLVVQHRLALQRGGLAVASAQDLGDYALLNQSTLASGESDH